MNRIPHLPIEGSSQIESVGYNGETQQLEIKFKTAGEFYRYLGVPADVYIALLTAPSKGRYFNQTIKNKFETVKITDRPDLVPMSARYPQTVKLKGLQAEYKLLLGFYESLGLNSVLGNYAGIPYRSTAQKQDLILKYLNINAAEYRKEQAQLSEERKQVFVEVDEYLNLI